MISRVGLRLATQRSQAAQKFWKRPAGKPGRDYDPILKAAYPAEELVPETKIPDEAKDLTFEGQLLMGHNKHEEALEKLNTALDIAESAVGENHTSFAQALHNSGVAALLSKDYEKGRELLTRALRLREILHGKQSILAVTTKLEIANLEQTLEDFDKSEKIRSSVVKTLEKTLTSLDEHLKESKALDEDVLDQENHYETSGAAREIHVHSIITEIESQISKANTLLGKALSDMAYAAFYQDNITDAKALYTRALCIYNEQGELTEDHLAALRNYFYINFDTKQGFNGDNEDLIKAKQFATCFLKESMNTYGESHEQTKEAQERLSLVNNSFKNSEKET
mmetsp:Transcript_28275/g.31411  ORF Transcript_28275/g.31411 Transcript_28275/m.31411 type:complete len:339 (-) Transcript_28275:98-1114(-)